MELDNSQQVLLRQVVKYILTTEWDSYNDTKDKHGDKVASQHIYAKAQALKQSIKESTSWQ